MTFKQTNKQITSTNTTDIDIGKLNSQIPYILNFNNINRYIVINIDFLLIQKEKNLENQMDKFLIRVLLFLLFLLLKYTPERNLKSRMMMMIFFDVIGDDDNDDDKQDFFYWLNNNNIFFLFTRTYVLYCMTFWLKSKMNVTWIQLTDRKLIHCWNFNLFPREFDDDNNDGIKFNTDQWFCMKNLVKSFWNETKKKMKILKWPLSISIWVSDFQYWWWRHLRQ